MPYRTPGWRIATGIVISLLLHLAALVFLRLPGAGKLADQRSWLTTVQVTIVPPPSVPQLVPEPVAAAAPARSRNARVAPRKPARKSLAADSTPPASESTLALPPVPGAPAQGFDREAARAAARDFAAELAPAPTRLRETRDEKLARQIRHAARPDCKDGIPGGLLAPLYLMMDKKDSGCKW